MPFDDEDLEEITTSAEPEPEEASTAGAPTTGELRLTARQFARARRYQWRHAAAFLSEMKKIWGDNARKPCSQWQPLWDAFWTRVVK